MRSDLIKKENIIYKFRREAGIFCLLFFSFLHQVPASLHDWNSSWYAMNYSLGFDSRLFIGSLLSLFYPQYLPAESAYRFVFFSTLLFLLLLSLVFGYALRQTESHPAGTGLLLLVVFYLISPGSPSYLWATENMGRFDLYLILLTVLAALFYFHISSPNIRLISFTLIGLIAIAIHQVFIFIFFPLLFVMFLDTMTENKRVIPFLLGTLGMLLLCSAFIYFQFFSHLRVGSLEELVAFLSGRTDLLVNETALSYEYFSNIETAFSDLMLTLLSEKLRYGIITLLLLSPLSLIYGGLWRNIIKISGNQKGKYVLILLSQLSFLPAFLLTIDWGRWFGAFLTVQALQIIILAAKKDVAVLTALAQLQDCFRKHPYFFLITGLWLASLSKFQATLLPDAPVFFTSLYQLYRSLFPL